MAQYTFPVNAITIPFTSSSHLNLFRTWVQFCLNIWFTLYIWVNRSDQAYRLKSFNNIRNAFRELRLVFSQSNGEGIRSICKEN